MPLSPRPSLSLLHFIISPPRPSIHLHLSSLSSLSPSVIPSTLPSALPPLSKCEYRHRRVVIRKGGLKVTNMKGKPAVEALDKGMRVGVLKSLKERERRIEEERREEIRKKEKKEMTEEIREREKEKGYFVLPNIPMGWELEVEEEVVSSFFSLFLSLFFSLFFFSSSCFPFLYFFIILPSFKSPPKKTINTNPQIPTLYLNLPLKQWPPTTKTPTTNSFTSTSTSTFTSTPNLDLYLNPEPEPELETTTTIIATTDLVHGSREGGNEGGSKSEEEDLGKVGGGGGEGEGVGDLRIEGGITFLGLL